MAKLFTLFLDGEFQMLAPLSVIRNTLNLHPDAVKRIETEYATWQKNLIIADYETVLYKNGHKWQVREGRLFIATARHVDHHDGNDDSVGLGISEEAATANLWEGIRDDAASFVNDDNDGGLSPEQIETEVQGEVDMWEFLNSWTSTVNA